MAMFLDLSDELIILIASYISKASHLLQLALANKKIHGIAIQHLYENVAFNQDDYDAIPTPIDYRSGVAPYPVILYQYTAPHLNVLRLSNMIRSNTLPANRTVTRLTILLGVNNLCNQFQTLLSLALPQFSSLKHLTLKSVSDDRLDWERELFSLAPLAVALSSASQTLQSLSMHFFLGPKLDDGWTIGSLRHFSNLNYLSIQGNVLLGDYDHLPSSSPSLDSVLPPGLKRLRLHLDLIEGLGDLPVVLSKLAVVLSNFVKDSLRISRETKELVVQLNTEAVDHALQDEVEHFGKSLQNMNERSRSENLDLRMALEWGEDCRWLRHIFCLF